MVDLTPGSDFREMIALAVWVIFVSVVVWRRLP